MLVGIVGSPNVGKSTFLKAATLKEVEIANYPFTTLEPNESTGYVVSRCVCRELNVTCDPKNSACEEGIRYIPVKLLDVAGLVPDAHKGRGRGVEFLNDLAQASALIHIIDASGSTDAEGKLVEAGSHNPIGDIDFLATEIDYWMLSILQKGWQQIKTRVKINKEKPDDLIYRQLSGLKISAGDIKDALEEVDIFQDDSEKNLLDFISILRKNSKPIVIAANKIDIPTAGGYFKKMAEAGIKAIPCSAEAEIALKKAKEAGLIRYVPGESTFRLLREDIDPKKLSVLNFIKEKVLKYGSTGVQTVINMAVFEVLGMIVVYPVENEGRLSDKQGNILPDAFLVPNGTTAKAFAGLIHTELKEKFLSAIDARTKRRISADQELKNNDVIKVVLQK